MRTLSKALLTVILFFSAICVFAQDKDTIKALIDRGTILNDSGKYDAAIDKYKEALRIDPVNLRAQYELSYTLSSCGRAKEAIPYLEKVAASNTYPEAYDLMASIYDDDKDYDKAVAYYKQGLIAFPNYERLHFNLGVSYLRQKKYADAEACSLDAMKLDQKHASSQRIYAIATYSENKLGCSLLAWCNFLILEPETRRSPEAYNYIRAILGHGIKWTGEKKVTITISPDELTTGNLLMPMTVMEATDNTKNLSPADSLSLQLTSLFKIAHSITGEKEPALIKNYFAGYFEKLGNSGNMAAFARLISLSAYKDENLKWFKDNPKQLKDLDDWLRITERKQ